MNNDSTTSKPVQDGVQHSKPIPISTQHLRHRSASFSSDSTSSPASSPPLVTPNNLPNPRFPASASSPIFQFLSQSSPTKTPATFPFRGLAPPPPPLIEDESAEERSTFAHHARHSSAASRFPSQPSVLEPHHERGVNVLRRLSLGGIRGKHPADIPQPASPQAPPNSAVSSAPTPIMNTMQPNRKTRRSATVVERPRRVPSPMGERILKGHFDGFN